MLGESCRESGEARDVGHPPHHHHYKGWVPKERGGCDGDPMRRGRAF